MTIKEMTKLTGLSADTLRYYERIGLIPAIPRTEHGVRTYDLIHVEWIEAVLKLRASGMTLEMIIEYVRLATIGEATIEARKNLLEEEQERLSDKIAELQERQKTINLKIADYYDDLLPKTIMMINKMNAEQDD
jgi:DNA-binding transcriptional MerR regulator